MGNEVLIALLLSLVLARITASLLGRVRVPPIASYIITGIILGPLLLKLLNMSTYPKELVSLALLFLLFYAGLNVDFRGFRGYVREAVLLTIGGVVLTTTLILITLNYLGVPLYASLIVAVSLSNTATEVVVLMLEEAGTVDDTFRRVLISASFLDDIIAVILMTIIKTGFVGILDAFIEIIKFTLAFTLTLTAFFLIVKRFQSYVHVIIINWGYLVTLSSILFFGLPLLFHELGLGITLGAYLAGLLMSSLRLIHDPTLVYVIRVEELISRVGTILEFFIIPIFFLYVGVRVDASFMLSKLSLLLLMTAFMGKFMGSLIPEVIRDRKFRRGLLLGIAMNVRGSLEPAVALIALESKVITTALFNSIIMVSLMTSLIIPILFTNLKSRILSV